MKLIFETDIEKRKAERKIGRAIKGLAPLMGINTIRKRLLPVVAPAL